MWLWNQQRAARIIKSLVNYVMIINMILEQLEIFPFASDMWPVVTAKNDQHFCLVSFGEY